MDKLLLAADKQANNVACVQTLDVGKNLFQQFMPVNPLYEYHCTTQEEYLQNRKSDKEKFFLLIIYIRKMVRNINLLSHFATLSV